MGKYTFCWNYWVELSVKLTKSILFWWNHGAFNRSGTVKEDSDTGCQLPDVVSVTFRTRPKPPLLPILLNMRKNVISWSKIKGLERRLRRLLRCQTALTQHRVDEAVRVSESETNVLNFPWVIWVSNQGIEKWQELLFSYTEPARAPKSCFWGEIESTLKFSEYSPPD